MLLCLLIPHIVLGGYVFYKIISKTRPYYFDPQKILSKFGPFQRIIYMYLNHSSYQMNILH